MKDYIKLAKEIISKHNLEQYVEMLLNYWTDNPPVLGHGFHHSISVAVEAYDLGILNDYKDPEQLFIGGLFHDIYRPVEDGTGNEDQTNGAEITERLLKENNVDSKLVEKIIGMINSHDDWRDSDNPPMFDLLISIADKITMSYLHSDTYVWSVNKVNIEKGNGAIMTSHFSNMVLWLKYQKRAWEVFSKYKNEVIGIERAIESYIKATNDSFSKYLNDPENKNYFEYFEKIAKESSKLEIEAVKSFSNDPTQNK